MQELQEKLNHRFTDTGLITTALTHSSFANEHHCESNERLEFLGDSILGVVVADYLFRRFPQLPEGKMTRLRAELVCEHSLHKVAEKMGFGPYLRLGRGEALSGGRERPSILADCVEAVIAALYLDGGFAVAAQFIYEQLLSDIQLDVLEEGSDYKTRLQELVQRRPNQDLSYALLSESGPDHKKSFVFAVCLNGEQLGQGSGRTKKEAEQNAARDALEALEQA